MAFVVTPDDNKMHTLNSTGTFLWQLSHKGITAKAAAQALVEHFEVDFQVAAVDAKECLDQFVQQQILVMTET
jgi:hypothetical protein